MTKVTLGQLADGVADLIALQGLDVAKVRNAVNSALGRCQQAEDTEVSGKASLKAATAKKPETFKMTERTLTKFAHTGGSPALRFYYFNQELLKIEQVCGTVVLAEWPTYCRNWLEQFKAAETPGETPAETIP